MKVFSKRELSASSLRSSLSQGVSAPVFACGDGSYGSQGSHWKVGEHLEGLSRRVGMKEPSLRRGF